VPTNATRRRRIDTGGPWGTGLLLIGVVSLVIGITYIARPAGAMQPALAWVSKAAPISAWAVLWILAGLYSVGRALMPPQRHRDIAPCVFVISLWAAFYGLYWLSMGLVHGQWTRDGVSCLVWASMAGLLLSFGRCVNPPRRGWRRR
jgi:hypothetical protein